MLNLKLKLLKDEMVVNRQGSHEQVRLFLGNFLGNSQIPNTQIQLNLDLPEIYKVSRVPLNGFDGNYTPYSIREGGNPLVFCRKNPLWTPDLYGGGISNLILDTEEVLILHFGKKGKIRGVIPINIFAPEFESLDYEILQDSEALKHQEVRHLRNIVDNKILRRLREAA